jgi:hypothetical protein
MTNIQPGPDSPAPDPGSTTPAPRRIGAMDALEQLAALQLRNRYIWLVFFVASYLLLQLTWIQINHERFETFSLLALLMAIIEGGVLAIGLVLTAAVPWTQKAWDKHTNGAPFSLPLNALATMLCMSLGAILLSAPMLYFHRYPELLAKSEINIPMMLLQRLLLLAIAAAVAVNIAYLVRCYLRLPWAVCAFIGLIWHAGLGLGVTYLSFSYAPMTALNDVFFYNQLWEYLDWFPKLVTKDVFHNIGMPNLAYFAGGALVLWILTYMLWMPRAVLMQARETDRAK